MDMNRQWTQFAVDAEVEHFGTAGLCAGGYWCVVCGRYLPADEDGVIVHDDVPHQEDMTFDEEERPQ